MDKNHRIQQSLSVGAQLLSCLSHWHPASTTSLIFWRCQWITHWWLKRGLAAVLSACVAGRTHLHVSWEREVLPEGVTLEAVVCQNAPQVWVVGEENTIHVPHLQENTKTGNFALSLLVSLPQSCDISDCYCKHFNTTEFSGGPAGCDSPPARTSWPPCGPKPQSPLAIIHLCTS